MTTLDELRARAAAALKDKPKGDGRGKQEGILGRRFGRLVATAISTRTCKGGHIYYDCMCDCGKAFTAQGNSLVYHQTKSCGCLRAEVSRAPQGERAATAARLTLEAEKKGGAP